MQPYIFSPSILSADWARLGEAAERILSQGADWIHIDVMDNHYVPNLTFGPELCAALRRYGIQAPLDVHLMVSPVDALIQKFCDAGASLITIHPEATLHLDRTINLILAAGCKVGLAFNPTSDFKPYKYLLEKISLILMMGVNPGFSGQAFIPYTLDRIQDVSGWLTKHGKAREIMLAVDGGVNADNIIELATRGARVFIMGKAIFGEPKEDAIIYKLKSKLNNILHK